MNTFTATQKFAPTHSFVAQSVVATNVMDLGWTYGNKSRHSIVPVHALISAWPPGDSS